MISPKLRLLTRRARGGCHRLTRLRRQNQGRGHPERACALSIVIFILVVVIVALAFPLRHRHTKRRRQKTSSSSGASATTQNTHRQRNNVAWCNESLHTVALGLLCASRVAAWTGEPSASRWQTRLKASISSQRLETSADVSPPSKSNAVPTKDSVVSIISFAVGRQDPAKLKRPGALCSPEPSATCAPWWSARLFASRLPDSPATGAHVVLQRDDVRSHACSAHGAQRARHGARERYRRRASARAAPPSGGGFRNARIGNPSFLRAFRKRIP